MIVNKNLSYLKEFLGINEETVIKAVVKGEIKTKEYRIKADYIEDGISLLVTDLREKEVFFRGLIYDLTTVIDSIRKSFEIDLGKFVVKQSKDEYVVWKRMYDKKTDGIREVIAYISKDSDKVVEFIKKELGVK